MSLLISPNIKNTNDLFFSLITSTAISCHEYLSTKLNIDNVKIKWINDLYYLDKKIGGILIENILLGKQLTHSIIGIGLNLNQHHWNEPLNRGITSLSNITGKEYNIQSEINILLNFLYSNLIKNFSNQFIFFEKYNYHLYKKNEYQKFIYKNNIIKGKIKECEKDGKLIIDIDSQIIKINFGELQWIE